MGQAAASRASVLETAQQTLQAVESVRSLGNMLAAEAGELKARLDQAEQRNRELSVALEATLKAGDVLNKRIDVYAQQLATTNKRIHGLEERIAVLENVDERSWGFAARLGWLVFGR